MGNGTGGAREDDAGEAHIKEVLRAQAEQIMTLANDNNDLRAQLSAAEEKLASAHF